jgi:hypothetical protein
VPVRSWPRAALWQEWYLDKKLSTAPLFSAAVFAPAQAQVLLARLVRDKPRPLVDGTDTYLYIRFVLSAGAAAYPPRARVDALRRTYPLVASANLGSYLAFAFDRAVSEVDLSSPDTMLDILDGLHATEVTGQARAMTRSVVDYSWLAWKGHDPVRWLRVLLDWLSRSRGPEAQFPDPPVREEERAHPERLPAWCHVIERAIENLVGEELDHAWPVLREAGWLSSTTASSVSGPVWRRMRLAVHLRIGHLAWEHHVDLRAIAQQLLDGTGTDEDPAVQRERAFFIVRHTVPVVPGILPRVRPAYYEILATLSRDRAVRQRLGSGYATELDAILRTLDAEVRRALGPPAT